MPARILRRVDLPVPLPPTRPVRSSGVMSQLASSKRSFWPKRLPAEERWSMLLLFSHLAEEGGFEWPRLDVVGQVVADFQFDDLRGLFGLRFVDEDGGVAGEVIAGGEVIFAPPEGVGEADGHAGFGGEGERLGVGGFVGHESDVELSRSGGAAARDVEQSSASDVGAGGDIKG